MKILSFALLTAVLSLSSCAHKKACCGGKEAVSCSKHGEDKVNCEKNGNCKDQKTCCKSDSCQKKS